MFTAALLACALESGVLNESRCIGFTDNFSPYVTLKECEDRVDEMTEFFSNYPLLEYLYIQLDYPEIIEIKGTCERYIEGELV